MRETLEEGLKEVEEICYSIEGFKEDDDRIIELMKKLDYENIEMEKQ